MIFSFGFIIKFHKIYFQLNFENNYVIIYLNIHKKSYKFPRKKYEYTRWSFITREKTLLKVQEIAEK
jgi:hypothetical protein